MSRSNPASASRPTLSIEDATGAQILPESGEGEERVVAAAADGDNSLTLLEEYSKRKGQPSAAELAFSFICAAASLAFAALIHINTH